MNTAMIVSAALFATVASAPEATSRPFLLPPSAYAVKSDGGRGTWRESGVVALTCVQAESSYRSEMSRRGWRFVHAITLNDGMVAGTSRQRLLLWRRGGQELTLMLRRVDVGKTAFSWGLSRSGENSAGKSKKERKK